MEAPWIDLIPGQLRLGEVGTRGAQPGAAFPGSSSSPEEDPRGARETETLKSR